MVIRVYWLNKGKLKTYSTNGGLYIGKIHRKGTSDIDAFSVYILNNKDLRPLEVIREYNRDVSIKHLKLLEEDGKLKLIDYGEDGLGTPTGTYIFEVMSSNASDLERIITKRLSKIYGSVMQRSTSDYYVLEYIRLLKGDYMEIKKGECAIVGLSETLPIVVCYE